MGNFGKIPLIIVAGFAWIIIISSCANPGMPTGGPKDTIPPVLVSSQPKIRSLNFSGDEVRLTFNEYIIPDKVSEALVVSPPLNKRPTILTKSKTLIIQFNEELKDSTTYSLDLKNSVVDNDEGNPIDNLRFSFSTGNTYDSLRVAGRVVNAFNLDPAKNALVMLYKDLSDTAVSKLRPDFIAKTDDTGLYLIDNIPPGSYRIYSINDANSNLMYDEGAEEIAFYDSIITPTAVFEPNPDTLVKGTDSLLISGQTHFGPGPIYLRQFTEDIFDQYISNYSRDDSYHCTFVFNEPLSDSLKINLIPERAKSWFILEPNEKNDSIIMWITDTLVVKLDTLNLELSYLKMDSAQQFYVQKDTLELRNKNILEENTRRRRRDRNEDEKAPVEQFNWQINIGMNILELNKNIPVVAPEPLKYIDTSKIKLYLADDTLKTPLNYNFEKDSSKLRDYELTYSWQPGTNYTLEIDSAAATNIYGITSKELVKKFKVREEDYYGRIILHFTEVKSPAIIQLLDNKNDENVIGQKQINKDQTVIFDYLTPAKYKIKVIFDENGNGKWDNGSFRNKKQPEKVIYWPNVVKVRSNWDNDISWKLVPDLTYSKNVIDQELIEQQRKAALEKAKQQEKNEQKQNQINPFQGSGGLNSIIGR